MTWTSPVFDYCERGANIGLWAEPINTWSNLGFLLAAGMATALARRERGGWRSDPAVAGLIGLVALIGLGSFAFHALANRWSRLADVLPIAMFMGGYLILALRRFLGLGALGTAGGVVLFVVALALAGMMPCQFTLTGGDPLATPRCLNGTLGYAPALVALVVVAAMLPAGHAARRGLFTAALLFVVAMVFRSIDRSICPLSSAFGRPRGTHALWHLTNAATLYVLLRVAVVTRRPPQRPAA